MGTLEITFCVRRLLRGTPLPALVVAKVEVLRVFRPAPDFRIDYGPDLFILFDRISRFLLQPLSLFHKLIQVGVAHKMMLRSDLRFGT
jgi:hypothetical protein